ncbi:MAG: cation:proton antiporter [Thermodesulfovibrionales bacterium]|nr:cation:proton antiporter [Thermodesulfovibrionales bacterium]
MAQVTLLQNLVIILGISALVVFILHRAKVPSIVGFLLAGILMGPHGLGFIKDVHEVELLAEIGVILLLFVIGIEFSLAHLLKMKHLIMWGGGSQVLLSILLSAVICYFFISDIYQSLFFGFLIALSSTAIVLKMLQERGEIDTPHGRIMVGILIFQDLCVVPLMLLTPAMSGSGIQLLEIAYKMLKAVLIVAIVLIAARWVVPELLHQVVKTKSRELFISVIILLCFGIALLTSQFGLSLALGAFLAGLIIAESEYASQATSEILPFKDSFIGLFFVSIGMLMDISFVQTYYYKILIAVIGIFMLKLFTGTLSAIITGTNLKYSLHTGFGLAQVGEFSFVLALTGKAEGLITDELYQIFLGSSVLTMIITPFVIKNTNFLSEKIAAMPLLNKFCRYKEFRDLTKNIPSMNNHVIIVGFGINGANLARVLSETKIPYVVIELNADTVKKKRKKEPIFYGDATNTEILHHASISSAKVLVIAISDAAATRRIVQIARKENPHIHIIVRTRYVAEIDDLTKLGADEVIPEEFETSIEIFSRTLHYYQIPRNIINEHINSIRKNHYKALRTTTLPTKTLTDRKNLMKMIETETYLIKENSKVAGHTVKELHLRAETGVTIIAIQRAEEIFINPSANFEINLGDILYLIGKSQDLCKAIEYLESERFLVAKYHR